MLDNKLVNLIYSHLEEGTWDFYRIELLTDSKDRADLIDYLNRYDVNYAEDIKYGGSIIIFMVPRSVGWFGADRVSIISKFGKHLYFSMEGNLTLNESALYKCYKEIKEKQDS